MNTKIFSVLLVVVMLLSQSAVALAQGTTNQWSAVQAVAVDERLIVKQKDGHKIEGRMIEASDTNLTLSRSGKVVNISRDSIRQIHHSLGKAAKGKWAAIGAGLGAGGGAGIGAMKHSSESDDSEIYVVMGLMLGAGAGAVTGLLIGANQRKRELIYQVP
jgi:hypothetical protein